MKITEVTFYGNSATIAVTTENEFTVRRVRSVAALLWMHKQPGKWEWGTLPDGTEQATNIRG